MAAERLSVLLLAVLVLGIFPSSWNTQELRCQCIKINSGLISPKFIKSIQLIPEDIYCHKKEVIVTLKTGKLICLDPEAEWVMVFIKKIMQRPPN